MSTSTQRASNSRRGRPPKTPQVEPAQGYTAQTISDSLVMDDSLQKDLEELKKKGTYSELVAWAKKEYDAMKGAIEPLRQQWYLNHAFYSGRQYTEIVGGKCMNIPEQKSKVRVIANRIEPVVRTELARMTSSDPTAEVVPASNEVGDIEAAKAAESLFTYVRESKRLKKKLASAAFWTSVAGHGYLKTYWDASAVVPTVDPDDNSSRGTVNGDVALQAVLPFNILVPDPGIEDIEDQPYLFNIYTKPVSWVNSRWAEHFKGGAAKATVNVDTEIVDSYRLNNKKLNANKEADSCLIIEAWVKPGAIKSLPNGGMFTLVNKDTIVQAVVDGFPYAHGEYPFAKIDSIPTGTFYPRSVVESLIPLQRELNRNRSQRIEARNKMGSPGIMYYRGSLDPKKVTNRPGELVELTPGLGAPMPKPVASMPPQAEAEVSEMLTDFEDISGQHQVSKGNTPSGVTAATAISYLSEQDNSYMSTVFDSIEAAIQKVASQSIQLFIQYADQPRLVKIVGRNQALTSKVLSGMDLRDATDIRVESGSSVPVSKAGFIAFVTDMMSKGMIDPNTGFELMDMPSLRSYYDLVKVDENQALRENMKFETADLLEITATRQQAELMKIKNMLPMAQQFATEYGMPMPETEEELQLLVEQDPQFAQIAAMYDQPIWAVNDFDDHEVHIEVHNRFRKSQTYENLPPEIQDEIDRHVTAHENYLQQKKMEEMMMMQGQLPSDQADAIDSVEGETAATDQSEMDQGMADQQTDAENSGGNQFSDIPQQNTSQYEQPA